MQPDPAGDRVTSPGSGAELTAREQRVVTLHEALVARLLSLGARLNSVIGQAGNAAVAQRIAETVDGVESIAGELRASLTEFGGTATRADLSDRLRVLVRDTGARLGCLPKINLDGAVDAVDTSLAEELVAAAAEALRNVVQHAYAGTIELSLAVAEVIVLEVRDDGVGTDDEPAAGGGLTALRKAAEMRGGSCDVLPNDPLGTTFRWSVPRTR